MVPNEINSKFLNEYCSLFSTIKKWAAKYKHRHTRFEDDPHEERPKSETSEIAGQIHNLVLNDQWGGITDAMGILKEPVGDDLDKELDMTKLCASWMQCMLTADQNTLV